ncbi:ABC transporter permease [Fonticella tunisiensis]|uniref:ABC-2 type transport system permease protein n=1 Tax=Fonticella tunisiensis TaxID=1096341 RepID=A0A4R7KP42_9CLOT|nr:ABC transporter permease [Fonticella tunisiensis]TDT58471.1 ABC-2 type transport system permease protein [Fonticella tunisiensis]
MGRFKTALINEIEKLYKRKKLVVALIISFIIIILGQLIILGVNRGFGIRGVGSMEFPMLVLSVVVNTILPLFTALVAIDSFSGEFSNNTMKIALTRPVTRLKFFTAKITAILLFVLFNLLFVMVLSTLAGLIFNANSFTLRGVIDIIVSYLVTLLPMLVLTLVIVVFTNILRSGVGVFFLSIFVFIILKALGMVFSRYSGILFTSMLDWYKLFTISPLPILKIANKFSMMVGYVIILFTTGYYLFDKKEF